MVLMLKVLKVQPGGDMMVGTVGLRGWVMGREISCLSLMENDRCGGPS